MEVIHIVANDYYELIYKHENQIKVKDKDKYKDIIQFTGHQPVGIAPVFNISKSNNNDNYNMVFSIDRYNNVDNLEDFENQYKKYISDLLLEKGQNIKLKTEIEFNEDAKIYDYDNPNSEINNIQQKEINIDNEINLMENNLYIKKGNNTQTP